MDSKNVLWITGLPGVGKSVIAAHLLTTLHSQLSAEIPLGQRRQFYLAYFFCQEGEQKLKRAQNIIHTISYQLALQDKRFMGHLNRTRFEEKFMISPSVGVRLLYNRLVQQPLGSLLGPGSDENVYCVIDGLDEADFQSKDGRSGDSEISVLVKLLAKTPKLRVLVLSRSVPEICDTMRVVQAATKEITATDNEEDIKRYVKWKVCESLKLREGFRRNNVDPVMHMRNSANGIFLWVDMLLRFLEGSTSLKEFESGLREIPVQFNELYKQILQRISSSVTDRSKLIITEVIRVVIVSPRELQVEELQALVENILEDEFFDFTQLLKSVCGTFLRIVDDAIDSRRKYVRVVHDTFREYITSDASKNENFHVSLPEAHEAIARMLLRYLLKEDFGSQLTKGKFIRRTEDLASNIEQKFPLLKYAASQWSFHLSQSSSDSMILEELYHALASFMQTGPLLLWIECLAIFHAISVLSRTADDIMAWSKVQSSLQVQSSEMIKGWSRDCGRFFAEYGSHVAEYPNSVYHTFFDLVCQPSVFYSRFRTGSASVSHGVSVRTNPAFVVNYDQRYGLSATSRAQSLLALASLTEIRILEQSQGQTVQLFRAPGLSQNSKWAVLAMAFSGSNDMFAAIYVSLPGTAEDDVPYCPTLSVWDIEKQIPLIVIRLDFPRFGHSIILIEQIHFSMDGNWIYGGGWKFNLTTTEMNVELLRKLNHPISDAEAVVLSPDCQAVLKLEADDRRTLFCPKIVNFSKPPYYLYDDDNPANMSPETARKSFYSDRSNVAPYPWWQLWREVTRSYLFSSDSRWFARFSDRQCVVLHDLKSGTEQVIFDPVYSDLRDPILINNLVFDNKTERLAWTFDHVGPRQTWDTRVEIWDIETRRLTGGFQVGRRYRERVEFCSDPKFLILYRRGVSLWDIPLMLQLEEVGEKNPPDSEDWILGQFAPGEFMRVGYFSDDKVFVTFREESKADGLVTQLFRGSKPISQKLSYTTSHASKLDRFSPANTRNILAMGDTLLKISNHDEISLHATIPMRRIENMRLLATAYHLGRGIMACLIAPMRRGIDAALVLQLYSTSDNPDPAFTAFFNSLEWASGNGVDLATSIVFDPSPNPNYILVVQTLVEPIQRTQSSSRSTNPAREGALQVWVLGLDPLILKKQFLVGNHPYEEAKCETWGTKLSCDFSSRLQKLICYEERRAVCTCQLWIIDLESGTGTVQGLPDLRRMQLVSSTDTIVAISTEGWVQCKTLKEMESEIYNKGNGGFIFKGGLDSWLMKGWKRLGHVPASFFPCYESGIAVHPKGEIAYIAEIGKRLVQIAFEW